jgi:hypothetical protein
MWHIPDKDTPNASLVPSDASNYIVVFQVNTHIPGKLKWHIKPPHETGDGNEYL